MKKVFTASLSAQSLDTLVKQLEEFESDLGEKEEFYMELLTEMVESSMKRIYDETVADANARRQAAIARGDKVNWDVSPITVTHEKLNGNENGYVIKANGKDLVFVEFGTGMYASPNEFGENLGIGIYPGAWSRYHERTWNHWVNKGYPQDEYPYTIFPANAIPKVMDELKVNAHTLAREIFGGGH